MPQHRVATSRARSGFSSRESIHCRSDSGTLRFLLSLPDGTETEVTVCVSGLVSYTTDTLYSEDGNGDGAVNVNVCVSNKEADFEAVRLVLVRSVKGANTVR